MGLQLSAPILHEETQRTTFRARSAGSYLLDLLRVAAIIILPIVASFQAGNMWLKHGVFIEHPSTNYTGRYLLKATDTAGNEYLHTSSASVLSLLDGDVRNAAPFVSVLSDDADSDGKADSFVFTISFAPRVAATPIAKLEFLPAFDYEFSATNNVQMYHKMNAAVLVTVTPSGATAGSSNSASAVHVVSGNLNFAQTEPLDAYYTVSYAEAYLDSFLTDKYVKSVSDVRQIGKFARMYGDRNETLVFDVKSYEVEDAVARTTTNAGSAATANADASLQTIFATAVGSDPLLNNGLFNVQIRMRVAPAVVDYIPAPSEVAVWAWVQWFCIGVPIMWALQWVVGILVRQAVVTTTAVQQGLVRPN